MVLHLLTVILYPTLHSQLNMQQLWGPAAQITLIHAHQDSPVVHRLSGPLSSGYILAHVLVEIPVSGSFLFRFVVVSVLTSPFNEYPFSFRNY